MPSGSASVSTSEIDLSVRIDETSGSPGLIIGNFNKGRINQRNIITTQADSETVLGVPTINNADEAYYAMYAFLAQSNILYTMRVTGADPLYGGINVATAFSYELTIDTTDINYDPLNVNNGPWVATVGRITPVTVTFWSESSEKIAYDDPDPIPAYTGTFVGTQLSTLYTSTVDYLTGSVKLYFDTLYAPPSVDPTVASAKRHFIRVTPAENAAWAEGKENPDDYQFYGPLLGQRLNPANLVTAEFVDTLSPGDIPDVTGPTVGSLGGVGNPFLTAAYGAQGPIPKPRNGGANYELYNEVESNFTLPTSIIGDNVTTIAFWHVNLTVPASPVYTYLGHYDPNQLTNLYDSGVAGPPSSSSNALSYFDDTYAPSFNLTTGEVAVRLNVLGAFPNVFLLANTPNDSTIFIQASYFSRQSHLFELYGDNQGSWAAGYNGATVNVDVLNNNFEVYLEQPQQFGSPFIIADISVSRETKTDEFGTQLFIEDRINDNSNYVRVTDSPYVPRDLDPALWYVPASFRTHSDLSTNGFTPIQLFGGDNGAAPSDADYITALGTFNNKEDTTIRIVMDSRGTVNYQNALISFCDRQFGGRADCFAPLYIPLAVEQNSDFTQAAINYRRYTLQTSSSFASLHFGFAKIFDQYTGRDILISPAGPIAARMSFTSDKFEDWYPPAGWARGQVVFKDLVTKPTKGQRDVLYDNSINMWKFTPGRGIASWGNKTLYGKPSFLDRISIRRMLIKVENEIERFAEDFLFELNTDKTRERFRTNVDAYLRRIKNRDGIYDYKVVCDSNNNTDVDIANYRLNLDYYLYPVAPVEYIFTRAIIVNGIVSFQVAA